MSIPQIKKITRWDLKKIHKNHPNIRFYGFRLDDEKMKKLIPSVSFKEFKFCVEYLRENIFTWIDIISEYRTIQIDMAELQQHILQVTGHVIDNGCMIASLLFLEVPISFENMENPRQIKIEVRDKIYYDNFVPF